MSYLNSRYAGQHRWKLSNRFESALKQLAAKCAGFRDAKTGSMEKDLMLPYIDAGAGGGWAGEGRGPHGRGVFQR